jgi:hypothetical protein
VVAARPVPRIVETKISIGCQISRDEKFREIDYNLMLVVVPSQGTAAWLHRNRR